MAEVETLTPELEDRLAAAVGGGGADVVVVMPGLGTAESVRDAAGQVQRSLAACATPVRAIVVHPEGLALDPEPAETTSPSLLPYPIGSLDWFPGPGQNLAESYRAIFRLSLRLGARACTLVGSEPARIPPQALGRLIEPILQQGYDLVTPLYLRGRFEGLLMSAAVAPLIRALYGRRILFPVGADLGLSGRMVERQLALPVAGRQGMPVWLPGDALSAGFQVGQAQLGIPLPPRRDPSDASAALIQVLGPLFLDLERNAAAWQKVRGSQPVPVFGAARWLSDESAVVEVTSLIETFRLGYRDLHEVWSAVLPPATLLELKRLTSPGPKAFRLADELWARIVYDFALAHRLQIMNRDHLLGAMTPLYLAWVASYVNEVGSAPPVAVEYRLEQVGAAFEAQKPYFLSRWRWPDRFNP